MDSTNQPRPSYRYIILAVCFCIQAIGIGTYVSYGIFFSSLISEFGWSRAAIAGASSMAFFLSGLLGILIGRINDRIGPRKMMTLTGVSFGVGLMLMSRLDHIWQAYLFYGVIFGIGMSSIDVIALSTIARWFVPNRGRMTGIVKVGTGAGQFIIPFIASSLIVRYGWRTSYLIIGGTALVWLVSIAQLLKRDPGERGPVLDPRGETAGVPTVPMGRGLSLQEAIYTRQFWTICAVNLTTVFCLMIVMVHIVPYARDVRIPAVQAATILSAIGGVSMVGRFITGIWIDRIGSRKIMILCFILLIAGLLWLQTAEAIWKFYVFASIYGIAHGGFFTAISPIVAEFFGIRAHGVLFGIVAFSGTVGGALGPFLAGYIFDVMAGYSVALWVCTLMSALGLALIGFLKPIGTETTA